MMLATEDSEEFGAYLAGIKSTIGHPFCWLKRGKYACLGWSAQTLIQGISAGGETSTDRVEHAVFVISIF
jgi:hypothetical protein